MQNPSKVGCNFGGLGGTHPPQNLLEFPAPLLGLAVGPKKKISKLRSRYKEKSLNLGFSR